MEIGISFHRLYRSGTKQKYEIIQDSKFKIQDSKFKIQDSKFKIQEIVQINADTFLS
jgi:hypothetical protein